MQRKDVHEIPKLSKEAISLIKEIDKQNDMRKSSSFCLLMLLHQLRLQDNQASGVDRDTCPVCKNSLIHAVGCSEEFSGR